ncbi:MAG: serine hydrolase [Pseudomonadales bacterium]|nr:serine hydrolase [Pseudomonadales bacterium]
MKSHRSMLRPVMILLSVLISTALILQYAPIMQRVYALATLADADKIASNFMSIEKSVPVSRVASSSMPHRFAESSQPIELPVSFVSQQITNDTEEFLQETGSTGMLILRNGQTVYERYWQGMQPDTTHISFSVAKSFTSALIGIAIDEQLIGSVDDPVVMYLPELKNSGYANATLADCLEMSGGILFNEDYADKKSDINRFQKNYAMGGVMSEFISELASQRKPGEFNQYNSMDAQVAGMVLRAAIGEQSLADYMQEKLWQPLGAEDEAQWLIDSEGMELALGGLNVTLRDYAKLGQLFLQNGQWGNQQIISADWVKQSTVPHAPHLMPGYDNPLSSQAFGYAYFWWVPIEPYGNDFFASGIYNQYIYVNPEKSLVIVKTTANPHFTKNILGSKIAYVDLFQTIAKGL